MLSVDQVLRRKREHMRKWRAANPELNQTRTRKHAEDNRDRRRELDRKRNGLPHPTRPAPTACEICQETQPRALALDHDHATGLFRGWLCHNCNSSLGGLGDTIEGLERAIAYLRGANVRN